LTKKVAINIRTVATIPNAFEEKPKCNIKISGLAELKTCVGNYFKMRG